MCDDVHLESVTAPDEPCPRTGPQFDVVYVLTGDASEDLCAQLVSQLQPEDQERAGRFIFSKDRLLFAVGRALLYRHLGLQGAEPPRGWRLCFSAMGKPSLERPPDFPDVQFNISHTEGVVVAAFSIGREIGVDVEREVELPDCFEIAQAHFAASEIRLLQGLSKPEMSKMFFSIWTLKEAYTKARGVGLSLPFHQFAIRLRSSAVEFSAELGGQSHDWFFCSRRLAGEYRFALAANRRTGEQFNCRFKELGLRDLLR